MFFVIYTIVNFFCQQSSSITLIQIYLCFIISSIIERFYKEKQNNDEMFRHFRLTLTKCFVIIPNVFTPDQIKN